MGGTAMKTGGIDFTDVQGLVRFGYGGMEKARYELLRVKEDGAARQWLAAAKISNAVKVDPAPSHALHVAFTAPGLRRLNVHPDTIAAFSHEFRSGMAAESRARQLGDVGANAPEHWWWGGFGDEPHLMVMFFGTGVEFEKFVADSKTKVWDDAFEPLSGGILETSDLDNIEPFGFADGISQPKIDWELCLDTTHVSYEYTNECAAGEFLLGYPNVYGKITDRPLLPADPANANLPDAFDVAGKKDLGRNGTYLVIRQLEQDVRGFWKFIYQQSAGNHDEAERLAASMVGRNRDGTPLATTAAGSFIGMGDDVEKNDFTFDGDPSGARCPFGAHIRRANPRNSDFPTGPVGLIKKLLTMIGFGPRRFRDDLMSSVRFHRILRRGREYGPGLAPEDAISGAGSDEPRGIHFICLNANISRQFEFVQNAWMAGTKFSGLTGESDPLLGTRTAIPGCPVTGNFTLQSNDGLRRKITGLPQFVTVRGGAYFFLPGISALRYLAEAGRNQRSANDAPSRCAGVPSARMF